MKAPPHVLHEHDDAWKDMAGVTFDAAGHAGCRGVFRVRNGRDANG
jgi:hypothetical protein